MYFVQELIDKKNVNLSRINLNIVHRKKDPILRTEQKRFCDDFHMKRTFHHTVAQQTGLVMFSSVEHISLSQSSLENWFCSQIIDLW